MRADIQVHERVLVADSTPPTPATRAHAVPDGGDASTAPGIPAACRGGVVGVKKNNKVHIQWASGVLRVGDQEVTEEQFMTSKWNKHVEGSWKMYFD